MNNTMTVSEFKAVLATQPKKRKKPEAQFQEAAIKYLLLKGYDVMRINSSALESQETGTYLRSYTLFRRGEKGSQGFPDLLIFKKPDRFMVIEIKSKTGSLNKAQKEFREFWNMRGYTYNKANNLDELIEIVERFEK